jgi:hypothetical protein
MAKRTLLFCLAIAAPLGMSAATAVGQDGAAAVAERALKGVYNCLLEGSFISRPFSRALVQFKVDGAGHVVSTDPGVLAVTLGAFNTPAINNPSAPNTLSHTFVNQICNYMVTSVASAGKYSLNTSGVGTLQILWTPTGNDPPCIEPITANYDILVNSPSSFTLMSIDLNTSCSSDDDYAACGSSLAGACQLQVPKLP